jgi:hypothetical protein
MLTRRWEEEEEEEEQQQEQEEKEKKQKEGGEEETLEAPRTPLVFCSKAQTSASAFLPSFPAVCVCVCV